jgi:polar amino acid transport system substrate-binding protein
MTPPGGPVAFRSSVLRMINRALKPAMAVAFLVIGLAACATDTEKATTESGVEVIKDKKLTVCTHLPYEPFQYNKGGETVGFDVDLMDLVAKDLALEQTIVNTPFETIETGQAMATGKCDIAAAGMTITEERDKVIDFSDPYFNATQALLTKKGAGYDSLESLEGKTLGVQIGTTGQEYANDNAPEGVELKVFEDLALLLEAVKNGSIDAAINDRAEPGHRDDRGVRHRRAVRLRRRRGRERGPARRRQQGLRRRARGRHLREALQEVLPDAGRAHEPRLIARHVRQERLPWP